MAPSPEGPARPAGSPTAWPRAWQREPMWDRTWQQMDRERLDAIHLRRIQELIEYAYERIPFYRRLYSAAGASPEKIRTWDDFHKRIPVIDKQDIVRDQEETGAVFGLESIPPRMRAWFHRTSGTTGTPLNEVFSTYDRLVTAYDAWMFGWWDAGLRPGDSMYYAFNFGTFIGFWTALFSAERMGLMIIPGGGLDTRRRLEQIVELRPTSVIGTSTYLLHMANVAEKEGLDLAGAGVEVLVTSGEIGPQVPSFREALRKGWGGPRITDSYGISETAFLACECGAVDHGDANGLHVIERHIHSYAGDLETFEPVQDESEVGEQVVTAFRLAQPLIKYRTHDLVRRQSRPDHGCGWNFAFLDGGVLGRTDDMVTIKATNVYTSAVQRIIGSVPGLTSYYEVHITREEGQDAMSIRVEAEEGASEHHEALADRLAKELRSRIGVSIGVDVLPAGALPRYELKSKRVFDHRREGGA